jgi:ribonucleoside-diphosphate reductase alpha chain
VRGSILSVSGQPAQFTPEPDNSIAKDITLNKRPEVLKGYTYQIKWPHRASALYLTLNEDEFGFVREVLCTSKDSSSYEWITALTLMITAIFKKGGDISFVANELKQIQSVTESTWIDGKHFGSLVAYIGYILERHLEGKAPLAITAPTKAAGEVKPPKSHKLGSICPSCSQPTVIKTEGCKKCTNCDWSSC